MDRKQLTQTNSAKKLLRKFKYLFILIIVAVIGGVLSHPTQVNAASSTPTIQWSTCPAFEGETVPANMECGILSVPLDYQKPTRTKITVAVSRIKAAKPSQRRGILLLNPGGPGGVGLDMPIWMADLMPQSVLDRFDLIGFDPRGVGHSAPVSCGLTFEQSLLIAPPIEQSAGFGATATFMQQAAQGCGQVSGKQLPYNTTANTAHDMDQIRQALGESKISYFGYSYGTYLGAVYASLFPANTDRIVLDSSTDGKADWRETFRRFGLADQSRFPDFAQFVIANNYGFGATVDEVRNTYFQLVNQLNQNPIPLPDEGITLNGAWLRDLTFGGLYSDDSFKDTAQLWKSLKAQQSQNTLNPLVNSLKPETSADVYPDVPVDNSGASTLAVVCDDVAWPTSVNQYQQELNSDIAQYPIFGATGSNIWPCAFWSNQPLEKPVSLTSNGPSNIMMVQNQRDPATPYAYALNMRNALAGRAAFVTVVQGGHDASYGAHNTCAKSNVTHFLVTGVLPTTDITCAAENATTSSSEQTAIKHLHHRMW